MPDLMNPEFNGGKKKIITWSDEKCASCNNAGACPLMQVIHELSLLTYSGCHVSSCQQYAPDIDSKFYLAPDASQEDIKNVNIAALQQELERLNSVMQEVIDNEVV